MEDAQILNRVSEIIASEAYADASAEMVKTLKSSSSFRGCPDTTTLISRAKSSIIVFHVPDLVAFNGLTGMGCDIFINAPVALGVSTNVAYTSKTLLEASCRTKVTK